jgi:uncharacterized protein YbbC (DUF1343 family)
MLFRSAARSLGQTSLCVLLLACGSSATGGSTPRTANVAAPTTTVAPARVAPGPSDPPPRASSTEALACDEGPPSLAPQATGEISRLVQAQIAAGQLLGAVVVVGRRAGVVMAHAWGRRASVPAPEAMTLDTVFDLASLTKPIATATSLALLAEHGKLSLDDRASRYVPELDRPRTRAITLRQLLLHTAGLPIENRLADYDGGPDQALARALAVDPESRPGARYRYSDIGYLWLGEIVRRVAGQPLDAFVRAHVFTPLGMRETAFGAESTLRARAAPTEPRKATGVMIRGEVHDPRAFRLGGVAGHAGLFSTAGDLVRFARMMLGSGELDGVRVLQPASVAALTRAESAGGALRTPGWDVRSERSRLRGRLLSDRAYGHGGFTGVSLWIDPERDLFVLFLSNRVHPDGKGYVISLVGDVTDAAVRGLGAPTGAEVALTRSCERDATPGAPVAVGIDVLRASGFAALAGKRVGLVTHDAARAADGRRTADVLYAARELTLVALFSPEHGMGGTREGRIGDAVDIATGLPVHSLFGPTRKPTDAMLDGIDALVVDLVDVGTRFFTYMSTVRQVLEAAAARGLPVVILDRPNPLGGAVVEGPVLDDAPASFVNYHPLPVRHGMTIGELGSLVNAGRDIDARLDVVPVTGWCREMRFDETGIAWHAPSPNLPSPEAALLYPAVGLLEGTNLSVGRGTDSPFAVVGAPWLDGPRLVAALGAAELPGVTFTATRFTPAQAKYKGRACGGVRLEVVDPSAFCPVRTGLAIARAVHALHGVAFQTEDLVRLVGSTAIVRSLFDGASPADLERLAEPRLRAFLESRDKFLRYPYCGRK